MLRLPDEPLPPLRLLFRGLELGAYGFTKLFLATSLVGFLGLLPTLDMAMRLGDAPLGDTPDAVFALFNGRLLLIWLATLSLTILVNGMMIARIDRLARNGAVDFGIESRQGLSAWLPLLGAALLCVGIAIVAIIPIMLVSLLVGAFGMIVLGKAGFTAVTALTAIALMACGAVYILFVQFFIVLERTNPLAGINNSFNLVYGNWWRPFLVMLILVLLVVGVCVLAVIPLVPWLHLASQPPTGRSMLERGVLQMVAVAVFTPFSLCVLYLLYNDLKLRRRSLTSSP